MDKAYHKTFRKKIGFSFQPGVSVSNGLLALRIFQVCLPFLWGALALHFGQDVNGDQLYYHYYSASAVLHGRFLHDIAAGGVSGFNNPLLYFPFEMAVNHLPAPVLVFLIGVWQGLNMSIVLAITRSIIKPATVWGALLCAAVVAYVATSPVFSFTVGRTFGDDWVTVPLLAGLWFLIREPAKRHSDLVGGLLVGLAVGMKITNIPTAAALSIALAIVYPHPAKLISIALAMSVGVVLTAGWWLAFSYHHFGNPLFPYYNAVFKSPLYPEYNFRDGRWVAHGLLDMAMLPLNLARGTTTVIESQYRETHWLVFSVLFMLSVTVVSARKKDLDRRTVAISVFCALAFIFWQVMLHYMRYLMMAELVLPIAVALMLRWISTSDRAAFMTMALLVAISLSVDHYLPHNWARIKPNGAWYQISDLGIPDHSTIIFGNGIGFVTQVLSMNATAIGIGTNFYMAGLPGDGGTPVMNRQILDAMWKNPNNVYQLTLLSLPEIFDSGHVAQQFGFSVDRKDCREAATNLGPMRLCQYKPISEVDAPKKITRQKEAAPH
jgi:hypothetical protein